MVTFQRTLNGKTIFPAGVIIGLDPANIKVAPVDTKMITESVKHAWYKDKKPVHPYDGEQIFDLNKKDAYSFVKAPRYNGKAMEAIGKDDRGQEPDVSDWYKGMAP
jgi:hydrogenase large subunit